MNTINLNDYVTELKEVWSALVKSDAMPVHADAIIVGGCRDLGLAERAAELYHAGIANIIVISGYRPETMSITEAKRLSQKCIQLGVPKDALVLEEEASNTGENIVFVARKLKKLDIKLESVILVHKPYMSLRFLATAEAQWPMPQPLFYSTCQEISFEDYYNLNGLEATAWKMLGDLKRMDNYVTAGYQTQHHIPESAKVAYSKITNAGFVTR